MPMMYPISSKCIKATDSLTSCARSFLPELPCVVFETAIFFFPLSVAGPLLAPP
jgi:hypothetical protein